MAVISRLPFAALPAAGAVLGLCGGLLIVVLPEGTGALAALALWTGITWAEGERGLSRWFPKLPLSGSLISAMTILLRWYALISLHSPTSRLLLAAAATLAIGQAASVVLAWISPPADDAALRRFANLTIPAALAAMLQGIAAAFFFGFPLALALIMTAYLFIRLASWFFNWRFGGVRASDVEANRVLVETAVLFLLASVASR
jgi:hypothetical protein